ncbi:RNA polymerase sigma factor [Gluconobacter frateurii]|uniref:ECF subfamily RNA polymerase sigma-70 factor n=1 Tax=Gluconobacter frateurii NRIC 0228 TaxID=1307946 RepID=A0ABQ0Q8V0_9PROT|nr:sigma-70 family RNA polymerase sigma factor [Gluconobacter frateurii]GBR09346.1 ECF subfamily RNA polymerase sigma-70 factor [Gluconobacter frateurii NRIC 0228]GLP91992.1 RNA polymerase sigma factor [Gluconobacter frateurii]
MTSQNVFVCESDPVKGKTELSDDAHLRLQAAIPALRRYARVLTRDPPQADDLVQDCLERALTRLHQVRGQPDLRPWLFTIAHRLNVNHWRRLRRFVSWAETMRPEALQEAAQIPHLEWQDVVHAFEHLSDDHRQIMMLVGVEGLQYGVVAEILDLPIGTVMSRLSRARAALHTLVEREERPKLRRVK